MPCGVYHTFISVSISSTRTSLTKKSKDALRSVLYVYLGIHLVYSYLVNLLTKKSKDALRSLSYLYLGIHLVYSYLVYSST